MAGRRQSEQNDDAAAPAEAGNAPPPLLSFRRLWPLLVLVAGLIAFFAFDLDSFVTTDSLRLYRNDLADYVDRNTLLMALSFIVAYAVMVTFSLPGALVMTVTSGFLFGSVFGTCVVVVGATIGATAIFIIAKTALGDPLRARAGPALQKMEAGFQKDAFNYLLILRLVPLFPFFIVNLVPAFLGVRLRDYVLATFFGIMPGTFVFAQVGTGLDSILESNEELSVGSLMTTDVLVALIGLAILASVPLVYKHYQRRKLSKGEAS